MQRQIGPMWRSASSTNEFETCLHILEIEGNSLAMMQMSVALNWSNVASNVTAD